MAERTTGLVEAIPGGVQATVRLTPTGGFWVASDRHERHEKRAFDFVVGPSPVAQALTDVTIRRPIDTCLDLGCGSGVQALHASLHSKHVVAADLNARAAVFARFNAALNGRDNIEVLQGDLFAAVQGRKFDLILCNPPYVLSPDSTFQYRDGGDAICARIVREAPDHLTEDGCVQMLCNWPQRPSQDWRSEVSAWFAGSGCDVWVLRTYSLDAEEYSLLWLSQESGGQEVSEEACKRWTAHFESLGIESVGAGLVLMRPAQGRVPTLEIRDAPQVVGLVGESIARTMAARSLAASTTDAELLDSRLCPSPDLEERVTRRPSGGGWATVTTQIQLSRGLGFSARVDPVAMALIGLLDGVRTLHEALDLFASSRGVSAASFVAHLPAAVRWLLHLGLLIPADEMLRGPDGSYRLASTVAEGYRDST